MLARSGRNYNDDGDEIGYPTFLPDVFYLK